MLSDADGDLHIVADPAETHAEQWRVVAIRRDGRREEIQHHVFWSVGYGDYEGRPGWFADGFQLYDIELYDPGQTAPHIVQGGRKFRSRQMQLTHGCRTCRSSSEMYRAFAWLAMQAASPRRSNRQATDVTDYLAHVEGGDA